MGVEVHRRRLRELHAIAKGLLVRPRAPGENIGAISNKMHFRGDSMKRPNGIVPKPSRGLWATRPRAKKGTPAPVTAEEIRSIKLCIVPGGDLKGRERNAWIRQRRAAAKPKAVKPDKRVLLTGKGAKMRACRDPELLNPLCNEARPEAPKPRLLPDLSKF